MSQDEADQRAGRPRFSRVPALMVLGAFVIVAGAFVMLNTSREESQKRNSSVDRTQKLEPALDTFGELASRTVVEAPADSGRDDRGVGSDPAGGGQRPGGDRPAVENTPEANAARRKQLEATWPTLGGPSGAPATAPAVDPAAAAAAAAEDAKRRKQQAREEARRKALESAIGVEVQRQNIRAGEPVSPRAAGQQGVQQQATPMQQRPPGMALASSIAPDPNRQEQKIDFWQQGYGGGTDPDRFLLKATRQAPVTPLMIETGWIIPMRLETEINSDLPGEIRAIVRRNVYDSATGKHCLIPQGTVAVGVYDSRITFGQEGVAAGFQRLVFPDGTSLDLGQMPAADSAGRSGLRDQVDQHYGRLILGTLLATTLSVGAQLSQPQQSSSFQNPSAGQIAAGAAGQQVMATGSQLVQRELSVQPTIIIRPGYAFGVVVKKSIPFRTRYEDC